VVWKDLSAEFLQDASYADALVEVVGTVGEESTFCCVVVAVLIYCTFRSQKLGPTGSLKSPLAIK
jgi:hypothetical protein